ncbi:MAG: hypothetical protein ACO3E8_06245 [Candidatus Methylacidiphilales bacterium]
MRVDSQEKPWLFLLFGQQLDVSHVAGQRAGGYCFFLQTLGASTQRVGFSQLLTKLLILTGL